MAKIMSMSMEEYRHDPQPGPSLSASMIHTLCSQSPRHAWYSHPKLNPHYVPEEDSKMDIGTIAHSILLEGVDVAEVLDFEDWRTKAAREARDQAREAGKVPILRSKWDAVLGMVSAARLQLEQHRDGKRAFKDGKPEQVILWEEDGIYCRARLDWLMNDHSAIWDYKTTSGSANPEVVSRTIFDNGADIQAAWYLRGLNAAGIRPQAGFVVTPGLPLTEARLAVWIPCFRFVYQETYPPYALSVIGLGPDCVLLAEKKIMWAMDLWRKCLKIGEWSGYSNQTCFAALPRWQEERWLEKETINV